MLARRAATTTTTTGRQAGRQAALYTRLSPYTGQAHTHGIHTYTCISRDFPLEQQESKDSRVDFSTRLRCHWTTGSGNGAGDGAVEQPATRPFTRISS